MSVSFKDQAELKETRMSSSCARAHGLRLHGVQQNVTAAQGHRAGVLLTSRSLSCLQSELASSPSSCPADAAVEPAIGLSASAAATRRVTGGKFHVTTDGR
jgi:hypothetical protein